MFAVPGTVNQREARRRVQPAQPPYPSDRLSSTARRSDLGPRVRGVFASPSSASDSSAVIQASPGRDEFRYLRFRLGEGDAAEPRGQGRGAGYELI